MTTFTAFVLGALIGWLVEWVIDWVYWRRRRPGVAEVSTQSQPRLAALEAELRDAQREAQSFQEVSAQCRQKLAGLETELAANQREIQLLREQAGQFDQERTRLGTLSDQTRLDLETELAACRSELQALQAQARQPDLERTNLELEAVRAPEMPAIPPTPDDLIVIKGIGPVIARLLNQNGIYTFEELAAQTPESLRVMLGDVIERLSDEESLLEQARQLAAQKQSKGTGG